MINKVQIRFFEKIKIGDLGGRQWGSVHTQVCPVPALCMGAWEYVDFPNLDRGGSASAFWLLVCGNIGQREEAQVHTLSEHSTARNYQSILALDSGEHLSPMRPWVPACSQGLTLSPAQVSGSHKHSHR